MKTIKKVFLVFLLLTVSLTSLIAKDRPTVALVLSGGGAKGIAHIALLEKLEELGIPVDMVMGTSMGSLIGGLYSAGYSPQDILNLIKENDLSSLFNVLESKGYKSLIEPFVRKSESLSIGLGKGVLSVSGILDDYKIMNFFYEALGNLPDSIDFDDLPIPFRCIGTNAVTGEMKVFDSGSLIDSMRASMSIPFAFSPMAIDEEIYIDGGLVNNMSIELAKEMGYDIIIAEDVNAKFEVTQDLYDTISGGVGALFRVIVNNTIKDQKQYADLILEPDLRGLGIFSFSKPETIVARGYDEVQAKLEDLKEIANSFTEDQKEYKDPNRQGSYFTVFEKREKKVAQASSVKGSEKAFEQTRFSSDLKISSCFRHDWIKSYPYEFLIAPTFENTFFVKEVNNSKFNISTKLIVGYPTSLDLTVMYPLNNAKNTIYAVGEGKVTVGSLTNATDRNVYCVTVTSKSIETLAQAKFGFKLTDETTHNMNLNVTLSNYISKACVLFDSYASEQFGAHMFYTFYPHVNASYVWYGESKNSNFQLKETRFDFLANAGFVGKQFVYKLASAFKFVIPIGENSGIWVDATAFTTREPDEFSDSYINYGGFNAMPGFDFNKKFKDYIYGGIGYQLNLGEGLISKYLQFVVRVGYREEESSYSSIPMYEKSQMPFRYMKNYGKLDVGFGAGVGFKSFLGEALIGVGITKDLNFALYFNVM